MKKYLHLAICFLLLSGLLLGLSKAYAAENPINMLQSVADQLIASLKDNKVSLKSNPRVVYALAEKIVVPHADLDEMSKRVLPPQTWNQATAKQRAEFEKAFTTLLVRTYATALADYTDQTIRFYPIRGGYEGKDNVKVDSQILREDGPAIAVSYRLIAVGAQWKLYDMVVEGVSLLESFRSQFADKLSQGDMDNLISELKKHNAANGG